MGELLATGWHPDSELSGMASTLTTSSTAGSLYDADAARGAGCPFGFSRAAAPAVSEAPPAVIARISTDDRLVKAAQKMAEQGMTPQQIAPLLGMEENDVKHIVAKTVSGTGKVLGNQWQ